MAPDYNKLLSINTAFENVHGPAYLFSLKAIYFLREGKGWRRSGPSLLQQKTLWTRLTTTEWVLHKPAGNFSLDYTNFSIKSFFFFFAFENACLNQSVQHIFLQE